MALTFPTTTDVRGARRLAAHTWDPFREPTFAVLGVGDIAMTAARDAAREAAGRLREGVLEAQARLEVLPEDLADLRDQLSGEDFRRLVDSYLAAARGMYADLVKRGHDAYGAGGGPLGAGDASEPGPGIAPDIALDAVPDPAAETAPGVAATS